MIACSFPTSVKADSLDDSIASIVEKLVRYLESKNESSISIGQFSGPPQIGATSGPGIAKVFRDRLAKHGIEIKTRANVGLKGAYSVVKTPNGGIGVRINGSLVDPFGDVLTDFSLEAEPGSFTKIVDRQEDVVDLLGVTTHLFAEDSEHDRSTDLTTHLFDPSLYVKGTKCAASDRSPYFLELLVHDAPRAIQIIDGLGFVTIEKGEIYTVRLYNESDLDAAVRLSIDGLNVFTFSEIRDAKSGDPRYSVYIVPPHQSVVLKGWHRTNEQVSSFLVTRYAESAAASLRHQQNLGTITAAFSAAWPKGDPPPHDEDLVGRGGNVTGFGPPVREVTHEVQREIGRLRAAISIRYQK